MTGRDGYGEDIYTEPEVDPDTLANLGPLAPLAGTWEGRGHDEHPVVEGAEGDDFVERIVMDPIDGQTNGPQLFYGLRYHVHIVKPGEVETFHDQVGYWLWEPAAEAVTFTLAIPRAQVLLAHGPASAGDRRFAVTAELADPVYGILSNPFLDRAFRTHRFRMEVTAHDDDCWSYEEVAELEIPGRQGVYRHVDTNTLRRVAPPRPNPLAAGA